jgi:hypothetical protein
MSRLVYSFSLPQECEAAWLLKEYKREGKVISHVIQKSIECDAKTLNDLELELKHWKRVAERRRSILQDLFGVTHSDFIFREDNPAYPPHQANMLDPRQQPLETLRMCRDSLKKRTEWTLNGGWDE